MPELKRWPRLESQYGCYTVFIYLIRCLVNGKVYVGITEASPEKRLRKHISAAVAGRRTRICCAIRKYKPKNFKMLILSTAPNRKIAEHMETRCIAFFNSADIRFGYNIEKDSRCSGYRHSVAARIKASKTMKGVKRTSEWKKNISKALRGKKRPPLTSEWRQRISDGLQKHYDLYGVNPDRGKHISESKKGIKLGPQSERQKENTRIAVGRFWSTPRGKKIKKQSLVKNWATRRRNGTDHWKTLKAMPQESRKRAWATRRKRYGACGMHEAS